LTLSLGLVLNDKTVIANSLYRLNELLSGSKEFNV
jgi:hypothetical protein